MVMQTCIHYDNCRLPVQQCNNKCERSRCGEREFGEYESKRKGRDIEPAEYTCYGWKTKWSEWYQNDSDFEFIGNKIEE